MNLFSALPAFFESFTHLHWHFLLLAVVFQLSNFAFRAVAWRNVLSAADPRHPIPLRTVGLAYVIGVALNGYIPARGGEAAKIALIRVQAPTLTVATIAASSTVILLFDTLFGFSLLLMAWLVGAVPGVPHAPTQLVALGDHPLVAGLGLAALVLAASYAVHRFHKPARRLWISIKQGGAILRTPVQYFHSVALLQVCAWGCRLAVVSSLLAAFGIPTSLLLAIVVITLGGMSTLVPVPGGGGAQQALQVFALGAVATTSTALAFSVGMQLGVTAVNTTVGIVAAMLLFRMAHPVAAARAAFGAALHKVCPHCAARHVHTAACPAQAA